LVSGPKPIPFEVRYRTKLRQTEKQWRESAGDYFSLNFPTTSDWPAEFIFCLYKDENTWTVFLETGVEFHYLGQKQFEDYQGLGQSLGDYFVKTDKNTGNALRTTEYVIWFANEETYVCVLGFCGFMNLAIKMENDRKKGLRQTWRSLASE